MFVHMSCAFIFCVNKLVWLLTSHTTNLLDRNHLYSKLPIGNFVALIEKVVQLCYVSDIGLTCQRWTACSVIWSPALRRCSAALSVPTCHTSPLMSTVDYRLYPWHRCRILTNSIKHGSYFNVHLVPPLGELLLNIICLWWYLQIMPLIFHIYHWISRWIEGCYYMIIHSKR